MPKEQKTNVCRLLDKAKIEYSTIEYPVNPDDLSAVHVAAELGEDIATVFKTLVLEGVKKGYFVCVIPGDCEVDLKKAAAVYGDKKASMILMRDLLPVTGYIRGGCCPLGMKKPYPVYIHQSCLTHEWIYISAGIRGMQIKIRPQDLISIANATPADIITS